ncbi:hypothetical protein [Xenorhabdus sp. KJ12.1]|uniref:hypothetical protein n=1 Tax=Xenorhabdus sp. KJ12.1 TaxID=1851571 RepID=UPI000C03A732|nr:hypothetical protein [Xenorhabdus sp. KJ12.1]PHM69566.1 hypothetical protein Xekj_02535 [Xenorhabdus sp. KJ12.1]
MKKTSIILATSLMLSGCASTQPIISKSEYKSINSYLSLTKLFVAKGDFTDDQILYLLSYDYNHETDLSEKKKIRVTELERIKKYLKQYKDHKYYSLQIDSRVFMRADLAFALPVMSEYDPITKSFPIDNLGCKGKPRQITNPQHVSIIIKNDIFCSLPVTENIQVKKIENLRAQRDSDISYSGTMYMDVYSKDNQLFGNIIDVELKILDRKSRSYIYQYNYNPVNKSESLPKS